MIYAKKKKKKCSYVNESNVLAPLSVRKKGLSLSVKRVMKCPKATRQPVRRCNSFLLFRAIVLRTTFT